MIIHVQVRTEKGFYGPSIKMAGSTVADCLAKVVPALERQAPELGGERQVDWTLIDITLFR